MNEILEQVSKMLDVIISNQEQNLSNLQKLSDVLKDAVKNQIEPL